MIHHPAAGLAAGEVRRQELLDSAEQYKRAEMALLGATGHGPGISFGGRWARLVAGLPMKMSLNVHPAQSSAEPEDIDRSRLRGGRLAGSRLLARIASLGLAMLVVLP